MACCNMNYLKSCNYKSAIRVYNDTTQTVTEDLTTVNVLGTTCTNTGCSISVTNNAVSINSKGLYYISADVTFTPTAAGDLVLQLYEGSTALPCAISQYTATAASVIAMHVETELVLSPCTNITPTLNLKISGVAGDINWVGMTIRKDA